MLLGSGFKPVVLHVEEWIYNESNVNPRTLEEFTEYVFEFNSLIKKAMNGLLEPYGNLLNHYGYFRTKNQIELLCIAYRELLEKIIPAREYYFGKPLNRL